MKRSYVLMYSDALGSREDVKQWIDNMPGIEAWRYELPNCFYLVADLTANQMTQGLHGRFGKGTQSLFLITEYVAQNADGWLPDESWHLLNKKELVGKK